jgi:hypothetical protein
MSNTSTRSLVLSQPKAGQNEVSQITTLPHTVFSDGKVTVKPFDVQMGKIKTNIAGFTTFDQKINYDLKMMSQKDIQEKKFKWKMKFSAK